MKAADLIKRVAQAIPSDDPASRTLEAEVLLGHSLHLSRVDLYAHVEKAGSESNFRAVDLLLARRRLREPLAYIIGHREFYGADFRVDSRVLIPRPETELLVDESLRYLSARDSIAVTVADVGTGCGCVAISLALNMPGAVIYAIDVSADALALARLNCDLNGVSDRVILLEGDMLQPVNIAVDLVVANLPYVPTAEIARLAPEIRDFEPRLALDGGSDGLNLLRRLLAQMTGKVRPGGCVLLEVGEGQAEEVGRMAATQWPSARVETVVDLGGVERVVRVTEMD